LFHIWNSVIRWYPIKEIIEEEDGFSIKIGRCRKFYLITDEKDIVRETLKQFTILVRGDLAFYDFIFSF